MAENQRPRKHLLKRDLFWKSCCSLLHLCRSWWCNLSQIHGWWRTEPIVATKATLHCCCSPRKKSGSSNCSQSLAECWWLSGGSTAPKQSDRYLLILCLWMLNSLFYQRYSNALVLKLLRPCLCRVHCIAFLDKKGSLCRTVTPEKK